MKAKIDPTQANLQLKPYWVIQLIQSSHVKQNFQYLPYATGLLQAYLMRHASDLSRYIFLPILLERKPMDQTLEQIILADVFGFSTYVWSYQYNLALARAIKARKPKAVTMFGGPQVPDSAEEFLRENPCVDVCVHGEGEITFSRLLENLPATDWHEIPGISWIDTLGTFHHNPPAPRQKDLDQFPSPYLMGIFDDLVKKHDYYWVALWETNRGCPFSCTFCDWGSNVSSKVTRFGMERIRAEIDWFAQHKIHNITGCDANFGILPRDLEITDYFVETRRRTGYPYTVFVQGAKNTFERSYQLNKKLIEAGLGDMVTISLQSINPLALKNIRRDNISLDVYRDLQKRCNSEGIDTYTDYLVGLPGETYESFVEGVSQLISEGQHHLMNFHNVYILPNAELNQPAYRAEHGLRTVRNPHFEQCFPVESKMEAQEWQEVLIGASSYSQEDWVKMRVYAWWIEILYMLRKMMQLPILLIHMQTDLSFRHLFEFYTCGEIKNAPITQDVQAFLLNKAREICAGEPELCVVKNVEDPFWLRVTDFIITGLSPQQVLKAFYAEQQTVLSQLLERHQLKLPGRMLEQSLALNQALTESLANQQSFRLELDYNLWEITSRFRRGESWELKKGKFMHIHDWAGPPQYEVRVEARAPSLH